MNPHEEIELVRRRIRALEYDLGQLRERVNTLENHLVAEPVRSAPESPRPAQAPVMATAAPLPAPPVLRPEPMPPPIPPPLPVEPTRPTVPPPPERNPLREWLEPLQLWPPSGEENAEVRLAAWWATRIGALLAVIGVVFLGLYVSRNAAPWVRLAEVVAVTVGVLTLGGWLERKLPKFGAVVFGAGLALGYFCAFAAYAVGPMKVISSPLVATACELVVVGAILATAWRRGSPVVATMAVALGHVTAFLALRSGPAGFGPWVVLLLGIAAVALRLARNWVAPSALAMPLAWAFLAVAAIARGDVGSMEVGAGWTWAVLYFVLYLIRDWLPAWRGAELSLSDRVLQVANSSLAFAVGLFVTAQATPSPFAAFYFGGAVVLLAATFGWWKVGARRLVPIFACKTAGMFALGVIAAFEGHARYLVLLAQAFAMLVSARQSAVRGLRVATALAGAVALGFFMSELRAEQAPLAELATLIELLFLAGALVFVAALQRWLAFNPVKAAFGSVVVGLAALSTAMTWDAQGFGPAIQIALAAGLAGAAALVRGWLPAAIAAAMLFVSAHVEMWGYEGVRYSNAQLWLNEAVLVAAAGAAGFGLGHWTHDVGRRRARGFLLALAGGTLVVVGFKAFPATPALAMAIGLSALLMLAADRARGWSTAALSTPLVVLGLALCVIHGGRGASEWLWLAAVLGWFAPAWLVALPSRLDSIASRGWRRVVPPLHAVLATVITLWALHENVARDTRPLATAVAAVVVFGLAWRPRLLPALECSWLIWCAAIVGAADRGATLLNGVAFALAWLPAVALSRPGTFGKLAEPPPAWRGAAAGIQVALATLIGTVIAVDLTGAARLAGFGAVAATAFVAWRWANVAPARTAALSVVALGWLAGWMLADNSGAQGWNALFGAILAAGAVAALMPFLVERDLEPSVRRRLRWVMSVAGLALLFRGFAVQRGVVADYATVGWGLAAVGLFLAGLFARSRPHRLVGLAGLALCVPRAFMVDLHSTLHRIAAFVALGVVLLWVGFSYHRFRHLITDDDKKL